MLAYHPAENGTCAVSWARREDEVAPRSKRVGDARFPVVAGPRLSSSHPCPPTACALFRRAAIICLTQSPCNLGCRKICIYPTGLIGCSIRPRRPLFAPGLCAALECDPSPPCLGWQMRSTKEQGRRKAIPRNACQSINALKRASPKETAGDCLYLQPAFQASCC